MVINTQFHKKKSFARVQFFLTFTQETDYKKTNRTKFSASVLMRVPHFDSAKEKGRITFHPALVQKKKRDAVQRTQLDRYECPAERVSS